MKIKEFVMGKNEAYLLLTDIQEKVAKNGNSYLDLMLCDGTEEIAAKYFGINKAGFIHEPGEVIYVTLTVDMYNGAINYKINSCVSPMDEDDVDISDFIVTTPIPPEILFDRCIEVIDNSINDENIKTLVKTIYEENKPNIISWGAAKSHHHNLRGGLIWHNYRMTEAVMRLADIYPMLDADIAIAGTLLHDIGKLREMNTSFLGVSEYTSEGNLFGHLYIGIEIVKEYGKRLGTNEAVINDICHIIASHHGKKEWGAIVEPATMEAYVVHNADLLDSRMYVFEKEETLLAPGEMSANSSLDRVRVYKSSRKF